MQTDTEYSPLATFGMIAIPICLVVMSVTVLYLSYWKGALTLGDWWARVNVPVFSFENAVRVKQTLTEQGSLDTVVNTRDLLDWAMAVKGIGLSPMDAANQTFIGRTAIDQQQALREMIQRTFGGDL